MKRKKFLLLILAFCLVLSSNVYASDAQDAAQQLLESTERLKLIPQADSGTGKEFPERFDLRDLGVVTPVKLQNPFSTCWGFAAIAAAETSILSSTGQTYAETGLDLSEHQLAWFARTPVFQGGSQDGEGSYALDGTDPMEVGGWMFTGTSVFASGVGPSLETYLPYRGHEGQIDMTWMGPLYFAAGGYSAEDDWSIDESVRFHQNYTLLDSAILDDPAVKVYDPEEENYLYMGYSATATEQIKEALMNGMAVSVAFCADTYMPGTSGTQQYLSDNWCHYTYKAEMPNHAVTIVGWDDTIPVTDFIDHSSDSEDGLPHQPQGPGAWIVKNSWGAETETFPNYMTWGMPDENGKASGYFYLSYYDYSLSYPEVFQFKNSINDTGYIIDEYDFMPVEAAAPQEWADTKLLRSANVFTAEADQIIRAVSVNTAEKNETVTVDIYLLDDSAKDPEDGKLAAALDLNPEYKGYHRRELAEGVPVGKGQKYSVVVTQSSDTVFGTIYGVNCASALNEAGTIAKNKKLSADKQLNSYCVGIVNPGESFLYTAATGKWVDWSDVVKELQENGGYSDYDFDNFGIKAYADFANAEEGLALVGTAFTAYTYPEATYTYADYMKEAASYQRKLIIIVILIVVAVLLVIIGIILLILRRKKKKKLQKQFEEAAEAGLKQMGEMAVPVSEAEPGDTQEEGNTDRCSADGKE